MNLARTARRTRRAWLPFVAAALLFAQMLGLVHRIAHAPVGHATLAAPAAHSVVDKLFGDHDDASKCRLYDQLTHADLAFDSTCATVMSVPHGIDALPHPAWHIAAQAAGFLARGPPAFA
jgi:hypothetical protein